MTASRTPIPFAALYDWRPAPFPLLPSVDPAEGGEGEGHETEASGGEEAEGHKPFSQMSAQERAAHYGYPTDTLVKDMTDSEQAAYYRAKSDKLEARSRTPGLSKREIASLQERAARADALEEELMTDSERAIAEARQDVTSEVSQQWLAKVVAAEVRGQLRSAGITDADAVAETMEYLNLGKLVTDEGDDVDPDRVTRALARIGAAAGGANGATGASTTGSRRPGPTGSGLGQRTPTGGKPGDAGRAEAARRFNKPKAAAQA